MIEYENLGKLNAPFRAELQERFARVLDSGWFILGEEVKRFEADFAREIGARHCIGVASGLDALILSLRALDLPSDSEVLVPSNTYIATILAIIHCGFKPVLVEPDPRTYNIDPAEMRKKITPRTRAAMIVHLYGKLCEMDAITALCREKNLTLIEDCAQSHGSALRGKQAGTFGIGCFSYYPSKTLGALGDAGAVTCEDSKFAEKIRTLRNYGSKVKYHNELVGTNSRLDEVQAGFLNVKLKALHSMNEHKRKLADLYETHLSNAFIKPLVQEGFYDTFHIYPVRHSRRDDLQKFLLENGIKTEVHYPIPPHRQVAMQGILAGSYPISEEIHATILSLPVSVIHTPEEIKRVCEVANRFAEKSA